MARGEYCWNKQNGLVQEKGTSPSLGVATRTGQALGPRASWRSGLEGEVEETGQEAAGARAGDRKINGVF